MNKPIIPNEVADVIEYLRSDNKWSNEQIIECRSMKQYDIEVTRILREIPFGTLMAALVNGYERELTEEQRLHEKIAKEYNEHTYAMGNYSSAEEDSAYAAGISFTLDNLGIQIKGVNA